ncbi:hypothetical protein K3495_g8255 [Podosphaera aphanis]|nr:hypothetical protein K3495_g8255 [Podosphaera aphanis]
MPLIIITGYPTSGKTYRASQLQRYLTTRISTLPSSHPSSCLQVHLISDHTLSIPRSVYNLDSKDISERSNNASEKIARATVYAAVTRVLSTKNIVILDSANYIKGWRYQLYCEAKAVQTPHCVVHVGTPIEKAREINMSRLANLSGAKGEEDLPYDEKCWENLVFRYEEPNVFARWDKPLFTIVWDDEQPPGEDIWEALIGNGGRKIVRPNAATVAKKPQGEDYLHEIDNSTQSILKTIMDWVNDHQGEGGEVTISDELVVELPSRPVSLPMLQRLKRQYISLSRTNAVPTDRIAESFVGYLNDAFGAA